MFADPRFVGGERGIFVHAELFVLTLFLGHFAKVVFFVSLFGAGVNARTHAIAFARDRQDNHYGQEENRAYFFHIDR